MSSGGSQRRSVAGSARSGLQNIVDGARGLADRFDPTTRPNEIMLSLGEDKHIPYPRTFEDCFKDKKKWQMPQLGNTRLINRRIIYNLLHYQTNYFIFVFIVFSLYCLCNMKDVFVGCSAVVIQASVGVLAYTMPNKVDTFRLEHPFLLLGACIVLLILSLYSISILAVAAVGLLFPILPSLVHAAFRAPVPIDDLTMVNKRLRERHTIMAKLLDKANLLAHA